MMIVDDDNFKQVNQLFRLLAYFTTLCMLKKEQALEVVKKVLKIKDCCF